MGKAKIMAVEDGCGCEAGAQGSPAEFVGPERRLDQGLAENCG